MTDGSAAAAAANYPLGEREGLRPLREHRAFIAVFILSALLSALALTYIYSERYTAEATIFFKPSDVTEVNHHGQEALGSRLPVSTQKNLTQTITQLATSDVVLSRVVADLHLDVPKPRDLSGPWYRHYYMVLKYAAQDYGEDAWKILKYGSIIDDPVGSAIYKLYKAVKITNDDSYVYTVAVSADTPKSAAQQTDKLVEVLTALLRRDDGVEFEHRMAELVRLREQKSHDIEGLEAAMQTLLASNRVATVYDELKTLTDRLSKLREQRADTQADLDQSEGKVAATSEKLRVPVPAELHDGYPAAAGQTSRISPDDYGKLTSEKLEAEVESRGLRARLAAFERAYNGLVPRIEVLNDVQAQSDLLAAKLTSAKRDYDALTDGIQELAIRQTTDESELHVQAKADGSILPVSPIKIYHVAAAAGLAALVAIGLAYVLDYFELRLFLPPAGSGGRHRRRPLPDGAPEPTMARGAAD
jgi:uncharacterized protein involved in exopolysaccharide biosynthesis